MTARLLNFAVAVNGRTVDFREKQLVLRRREDFRPPHDAEEHRLTVRRPVTTGSYVTANPCAGWPEVAAKVDGVRTSLMLDTGSAAGGVEP